MKSIKSGSKSPQKKPNTEFLYFNFKSLIANNLIKDLRCHICFKSLESLNAGIDFIFNISLSSTGIHEKKCH